MATLNVENKVVSFGDVAISNNPRLKYVDWLRTVQGIEISEPVTKSSDVAIDAFFDVAGDDQTVSDTSYTIDSINIEDDTRTKIYGNFGHTVVAPLTKLDSIAVLSNGLVNFVFNSSEDMTDVAVGDQFNIRGLSTGDGESDINPLNEGLWKIVKLNGNTALCRKMDGCSGAISQDVGGTLDEDHHIVIFRNPYAIKGNYAYVKEEGSEKVKPLYPVIYADSQRIDIGFVPFVIDTSGDDGKLTIVQNKFCFAYVETNGDCTVLVQAAVRDFKIPVSTITLPNGEKIGWVQLTSDFNFIQVQNTGDQPIKVSAIVGG